MNIFVAALLAGVGTARIVETIKEAIPVVPPPWVKSLAVLVLSAIWAFILYDTTEERLALFLGSAGVSMIFHDTVTLLSLHADRIVASLINPRRR